jgi:RNA polymerase sigma-70 factor (sigma-E family)
VTAAPVYVTDRPFLLDRDEMTAVVDEQWVSLVRMGLLLLGDRASAEDAVQDACEATWRLAPAVRDRDHLIAYLRTAVVNRCRSAGRRRSTAQRFLAAARPADEPAADVPVLAGEADRALLDALHRLSPRQREVVVLRYWSGLSERQIAEALDIAPGTVKSTASDALTRLHALLGDLR